ncbi:MAG: hypothetical protein D6726_05395 [Nitrospirae bacterium]|nr:MAG: hypothetical protein D6726_05395 [Nitrospirota bacterium]
MSAKVERPIDEIKKENSQAWNMILQITNKINEMNRALGLPEQSIRQLTNFEIVITDTTTPEDEEMQYITYYLKQGYPFDEAKKKARELKNLVDIL